MPKIVPTMRERVTLLYAAVETYWKLGTVVLAVAAFAFWLWSIQAMALDAQQKISKQDAINEKLTAIIVAQDKSVAEQNARLAVYLELYGINKDTAAAFAAIPREPKRNDQGQILFGAPWVVIDSSLNLGILFRVMPHPDYRDSVLIEQRVLWDFTKEKK